MQPYDAVPSYRQDAMPSLPNSQSTQQRNATEAAEYIALELGRLMRMASAHGFTMLPYLIDMAVLEAWREATEPDAEQPESGDPQAA